MRAAIAAALAAIVTLAGCREPGAPVDYRPEEAGTVDHALCLLGFTGIPLQPLSSGHHAIAVNLNGRAATFILDTGANVTVLNAPFAADFGLPPAIGGTNARQARIESLAIGSLPIRQERIAIADLGQLPVVLGRMVGTTIHGIIGQDVMKEHRAVIDVARSVLYLVEEDRDPAPIPAEGCAPPQQNAVEGVKA